MAVGALVRNTTGPSAARPLMRQGGYIFVVQVSATEYYATNLSGGGDSLFHRATAITALA